MADVLETEIQTFEARREELAKAHTGEFALVRGSEIVGFFPTRDMALAEGYRLYDRASFLVKKVEAHEEPAHFASTLIRPPSAR